ncbi:hypothetical protein [Acidovorax sp.]|uniref:hypothetical protein n=1 Tax=Acidovorax sp. TaxID=1872122 RepID=UPI003CFDD453
MHSIPIFSNGFSYARDEPMLTLVDLRDLPSLTEREMERSIECLQTKAFVFEARKEAGATSNYKLEELMMEGLDSVVFPDDRPKICDRMARSGRPSVAKILNSKTRTDPRNNEWIDRILALAPRSTEAISLPLWRAIDPRPMTHVQWHAVSSDLGEEILRLQESEEHARAQCAWMVRTKASESEDEVEHYTPFIRERPDRLSLAILTMQIRRWEAIGDLVGYTLALQQTLRVANHKTAAPNLAALQPDVGKFIAQCYGPVLIAYPESNLEYQRDRVTAANNAWEKRVLVGDDAASQASLF